MSKNNLKGSLKGCGIMCIGGIAFFVIISMIIAILPSSAKELHNNALKAFNKQDYSNAVLNNTKAIEKDSLQYQYHFLNAKLFLELKDTLASYSALNKTEKLIDKAQDSTRLAFYKALVDWKAFKKDTVAIKDIQHRFVSKFKTSDFKDFSTSLFYTANRTHQLGNSELASTFLNTLIDTISHRKADTAHFKRIHYQTSKLFFKYKDSLKGVAALKTLIKAMPNAKSAHKNLGDYYLKKTPNKAIHYYENYLKLDTLDASIYRNIAIAYLAKKHKKSALKYFKIAKNKGDHQACLKLRTLTAKTRYNTRSLCWDGSTSYSTGRGTCSHHGGVRRLQYIPYKVYTVECR